MSVPMRETEQQHRRHRRHMLCIRRWRTREGCSDRCRLLAAGSRVQARFTMLKLFPFAAWLAPLTSLAALVVLTAGGDLRPRGIVVVPASFLGALYLQFLSGSPGLV